MDIPAQTEVAEVKTVQADKILARLVTEPTLVLILVLVVTDNVRQDFLVGTQEVGVQVIVTDVTADRVVEVGNSIAAV